MNLILQPWQLLVAALASWVHHEQQKIIQFYQAEVKAMMEAQGKKRLLLSDDHRRLLAVKGKSLGRKALMELTLGHSGLVPDRSACLCGSCCQ